jgi:anti-sigma B factor antagonist
MADVHDAEASEPFDLEVRHARGRVAVVPRGELDMTTVSRLAETIDGLVAGDAPEIFLDLRHLTFMDSTGLKLVIRVSRRHDAVVRVIDGTGPVARVFDVAGVRHAIPFASPHDLDGGP